MSELPPPPDPASSEPAAPPAEVTPTVTASAPPPLLAIGSLIAGVGSLVLLLAPGIPLPFALGGGALAVLLSALHRSPVGKGFAIAGMTCGLVAIALGLLFFFACRQASSAAEDAATSFKRKVETQFEESFQRIGEDLNQKTESIGRDLERQVREGAKDLLPKQ